MSAITRGFSGTRLFPNLLAKKTAPNALTNAAIRTIYHYPDNNNHIAQPPPLPRLHTQRSRTLTTASVPREQISALTPTQSL